MAELPVNLSANGFSVPGQEAFDLLSPILRACVIERGSETSEEERIRAAESLRQYIADLAADETRSGSRRPRIETGITATEILDRLRAIAREFEEHGLVLGEIYAEGTAPSTREDSSSASRYQWFRFVASLLTRPPTNVKALERSTYQSARTLKRWYADGDLDYVKEAAREVVERLVEALRSPEPPTPEPPVAPLRSFDELGFLGGLRRALIDMYTPRGAPPALPKPA
jgi:hypothetical protein